MSFQVVNTDVDPVRARLDPDRLSNVTAILNEGVEQGLYPGGVVWIGRNGADALVASAGHTDFDRTAEVDEDTLFDMASLTKPISCASSILLALQQGKLHLGQTVPDFFPDRQLPHLAGITVRQLLTHVSGIPAWKNMYGEGQNREQVIDEVLSIPLANVPGTTYVYSCLNYIILSVILEVVTGERIDVFARKRIFEPMGMMNTLYNPDPTRWTIAATDNCDYRKRKLVGEVHDGNACALGGVSGNAGLFSSARDLALFCHSITSHCSNGNILPLGPAVVKKIFSNAIPESIGGQSLGWFMLPGDMMCGGDLISKSAISHSGFTGTAVLIDPEWDLFAIYLTNRVCKNDDGTPFRHLRRKLFNAALGAIVC